MSTAPSDAVCSRLLACEHCDAVYLRTPLQRHQTAHCQRCGAELDRPQRLRANHLAALTLTAALLFIVANAYPIAEIEFQGRTSSSTVWGAILSTGAEGNIVVSVMAALTLFFAPLLELALLGWVALSLHFGRRSAGFARAMHALRHVRPWSMTEVFLLGALVSVFKIRDKAEVVPGLGLYAFGLLAVLLTLLGAVSLRQLWDLAAERRQ